MQRMLIYGSVCLLMLCTLSNASVEPLSLSLPLLRWRRQVVQPTWLRDNQWGPSSTQVHATPQSLQEAAAIRAQIQRAIADGTYAVTQETPQRGHPAALRPRPTWPPLDFHWPLPAIWPSLLAPAQTRAPRLAREQYLLFV